MKRVGVFVDISNLYYCIQKKYPKQKLDYRKYKRFIQDLGDIQFMVAYGAQMSQQAEGFKYCLKQMGFSTKYKKPKTYTSEGGGIKRKADHDVNIAMDIVDRVDRMDMIVLGSGDGDMLAVVEWAMRRGVDVVILASGISKDLRINATQTIEIPPSLLESTKPKGAKRPREMAEEKIKEGADPESLHSVSDNREDSKEWIRASDGVQGSVAELREDGSSDVSDSDSPSPTSDTPDMGLDKDV